jgi:Zn-dependent peptidase ImmA (M78 family)/transcriptional regulator with XRE-family HTH domain
VIVPDRVVQARELAGLTQKRLALDIGFSQSQVANVESGRYPASQAFATGLAARTGFPVAFFRRLPGPRFSADTVLFRAKASAAGWEHRRARRYGEVLYEALTILMRRLRPIPLMLPVEQGLHSKPHRAAWMTRAAMGYSPQAPIDNLLRDLERRGVLAAAVPLPAERHSALATWGGDDFEHPFLAIFATPDAERQRFSVAHELGHLVMHHSYRQDTAKAEAEANAFATELLLPAAALRRELRSPVTLSALVSLRAEWGVSIAALIRRARELDVVTERQYRHLFTQLSARGWRTAEPPSGRPVERPRGFRRMVEVLYGDRPDLRGVARDLAWEPVFLRGVIEHHAPAPVPPASASLLASASGAAAPVIDLASRVRVR